MTKQVIVFLLVALLLNGSCAPMSLPAPSTETKTTIVSRTPNSTQTAVASQTPTKTPTPLPTTTITLTPSPTFTAFPYPTKITDAQGVVMALVPAGEFMMGNDEFEDERPAHKVYLDAFYIDIYEVTNKQYKDCADAGICLQPQSMGSNSRTNYYGNPQYNHYPVIFVNWDMAKMYCEWRGTELPTEAQWEKAARGTDGRTYPWGEEVPDCRKANYSGPDQICIGDTSAVGTYESGKSPYGVYDMAGNVWEWVTDWYSPEYYKSSPTINPMGPDFGQTRILRGGAWLGLYTFLRSSGRHPDSQWEGGLGTAVDTGFRCSRSLP